jgi:hypothetical protein
MVTSLSWRPRIIDALLKMVQLDIAALKKAYRS